MFSKNLIFLEKKELQKEQNDWLGYFQSHVEAILYFDRRGENILYFIDDTSAPDTVMEKINSTYSDLKLERYQKDLPLNHDSSHYDFFLSQKLTIAEKLFIDCVYYKRRIDNIKSDIQKIDL